MTRALEAQARHEQQQAMRALLKSPLLPAAGAHAASFLLVRRHAAALRAWFARFPRWSLHVEIEQARLRKTPADLADGTRPALDPIHGAPFTRRRYVLLCLALLALDGEDRQTTLGRLAGRVMGYFAGDPALAQAGTFALDVQDQRRDLVHVVRLLLDLRVLARVTGEEQGFIADQRRDVLYNVNRPALAAMPSVRRGPSTVETDDLTARLACLVEELAPETEDGRNQALRARLFRRLLDDPVVYYDDLGPDERAYLTSQRPFIVGEIEAATGLVAEARREGLAMVDPHEELTDLAMPEEGTEGHLTLLVAEWLAGRARNDERVGRAAVEQHVAGLIAVHRGRWKKAATEPGAEVELTDLALARLTALRLLRWTPAGIEPLPALARYAVAAPAGPRAQTTSTRAATPPAERAREPMPTTTESTP
ncbi:TIGR02678 family protein [Sorangium sp. So ce134]